VKQGFDSTEMTAQEVVEFCERLEFIEDLDPSVKGQNVKPDQYGGSSSETKSSSKSSRGGAKWNNHKKRRMSAGPMGTPRDGKYCELHGVYGHDLSTCKVMLDQAKKMKAAWETMHGSRGPVSAQLDRHQAQKQKNKELHSLVQNLVQDAIKEREANKTSKKRKGGATHVNFTEPVDYGDYDGVDEFANLGLEDVDSDDDLSEFAIV
jgi:hypothetical protein